VILGRLFSGAPADEAASPRQNTASQTAAVATTAEPSAFISFYRDDTIDTFPLVEGQLDPVTMDVFSEQVMSFDQARTGALVYTRRDDNWLESDFIYYRELGNRGVVLDRDMRGCRFPAISPDGDIIVCVKGGLLYRYDWRDNRFKEMPLMLADDTPARAAGAPQAYNDVVVVPVVRAEEPHLALFDARDGDFIKIVRNTTTVVFNAAGRLYATPDDVGGKPRVLVWDVDARSPRIVALSDFIGKTTVLTFSTHPDSLLLTVQADDGTHLVWVNWPQDTYVVLHTFEGAVSLLADLSDESDFLLTRLDTGEVLYVNLRDEYPTPRPLAQARAARWVYPN
jgi:WD40 repeat protein